MLHSRAAERGSPWATLNDVIRWKRCCPYACGVVIAFASLSMAAPRSECISIPIDVGKLLQEPALVFAGTVIEADAYRLTFRPDRVWKGKPSDRASVYLLGHPYIGAFVYRPGQRYVVAARILGKDERTSNGIEDPADKVFGFERPCGVSLPLSLVAELDKRTRPRAPRSPASAPRYPAAMRPAPPPLAPR